MAECVRDEQCDNGLLCDGVEVCAFGECIEGTPVVCDDGVACTRDRCSEAGGGCVPEPRDEDCPEDDSECGEPHCDPVQGCMTIFVDEVCDDGIECTLDICDEGTCSSAPDHGSCAEREYCELEPDDGRPGCRNIPNSCVMTSDCVELPCNTVACDPATNTCEYVPVEMDVACSVTDECRPAICVGGVCTFGEPLTCAAPDRSLCTADECVRNAFGEVDCVPVPRTGSCSTMPCSSGTCAADGTCAEGFSCPDSSDPCLSPVCMGGGCTLAPFPCGASATCVGTTAADVGCRCDAGFEFCDATGFDCCPILPDAGTSFDSGLGFSDAGHDSGAGFDAGSDSGVDAGTDSGVDAGTDSGVDAGTDAGMDSGTGIGIVDAAITLDASVSTFRDGGAGGGCAFPLTDCGGGDGCTCDRTVSMCDLRRCVCLLSCRGSDICCAGVRGGYCAPPGSCVTPMM